MQELTDRQLKRQDFVDAAVFQLMQTLNPTPTEIQWSIEMIADVRETIRHWLVDTLRVCDEMSFYPYVQE